MGYIYILLCGNGRYYVGSTDNVERRFAQHQEGRAKATKNIRPVKLLYTEEFGTLLEARRREREIKSKKSREYVEDHIKESTGRSLEQSE